MDSDRSISDRNALGPAGLLGGWNVLLYAIGGDDSEDQRITDAIADMRGALTANRCNIAVQVHARSKTTRHWIAAGTKVRTEVLPVAADASEASSLTSFLDAGARAFPNQPTALVLWAHSSGLDYVHDAPPKHRAPPSLDSVFGGGDELRLGGTIEIVEDPPACEPWRPTGSGAFELPSPRRPERYGCRWGPDPTTKKYLTNIGMKKGIAGSVRKRVQLLGLNACWMASLEVEYELRDVADAVVASQVSAHPWPYGAIIAQLMGATSMDASQLATAIVGCVRAEIVTGKRDDTISALITGPAMDRLAAAFDAYARRVLSLIETDWESVKKAVMIEAQRVDDPYQVDVMSLIHELGKHDLKAKIAAAAVESQLRSMVVAHAAAARHPGVSGLSVFCPKSTLVDLGDAYRGTSFRTNTWAQFLRAFQIKLSRTPSA